MAPISEYNLGKHPFSVTYSELDLGCRFACVEEDKRNFITRKLLSPELFCGIFNVDRWVYIANVACNLSERDTLRRGDIYYQIALRQGNYTLRDVTRSHVKLANIARRDSEVKYIVGLTWLPPQIGKRWGWENSGSRRVDEGVYLLINDLVNEKITHLNRHGDFNQARRIASKFCDSTKGERLNILYMSRKTLIDRYGRS